MYSAAVFEEGQFDSVEDIDGYIVEAEEEEGEVMEVVEVPSSSSNDGKSSGGKFPKGTLVEYYSESQKRWYAGKISKAANNKWTVVLDLTGRDKEVSDGSKLRLLPRKEEMPTIIDDDDDSFAGQEVIDLEEDQGSNYNVASAGDFADDADDVEVFEVSGEAGGGKTSYSPADDLGLSSPTTTSSAQQQQQQQPYKEGEEVEYLSASTGKWFAATVQSVDSTTGLIRVKLKVSGGRKEAPASSIRRLEKEGNTKIEEKKIKAIQADEHMSAPAPRPQLNRRMSAHQWNTGDACEYLSQTRLKWFPAVVERVNVDGTYNVRVNGAAKVAKMDQLRPLASPAPSHDGGERRSSTESGYERAKKRYDKGKAEYFEEEIEVEAKGEDAGSNYNSIRPDDMATTGKGGDEEEEDFVGEGITIFTPEEPSSNYETIDADAMGNVTEVKHHQALGSEGEGQGRYGSTKSLTKEEGGVEQDEDGDSGDDEGGDGEDGHQNYSVMDTAGFHEGDGKLGTGEGGGSTARNNSSNGEAKCLNDLLKPTGAWHPEVARQEAEKRILITLRNNKEADHVFVLRRPSSGRAGPGEELFVLSEGTSTLMVTHYKVVWKRGEGLRFFPGESVPKELEAFNACSIAAGGIVGFLKKHFGWRNPIGI